MRQRQVIAVKGDAVYTITWSVSADEFEAQEATLDAMSASWRWLRLVPLGDALSRPAGLRL